MADLILKPATGDGNKLILQDKDGDAVLTTADSGATINAVNSIKVTPGSTPSGPGEGEFYYNSTQKQIYVYDGSRWVFLVNGWPTFGGTESFWSSSGTDYHFHYFLETGTLKVATAITADIFLVGGGGGGGGHIGGGGGAGGLVDRTGISVPVGMYRVNVGAGGLRAITSGNSSNVGSGLTGGDSSISQGANHTILCQVANGGGGGGSGYGPGRQGGSGGGCGHGTGTGSTAGATKTQGGTGGYGNNGGSGTQNGNHGSGGGGGAASVGGNGSNGTNGAGGDGKLYDKDPYGYWYAGGGGGGGYQGGVGGMGGAGGAGGGGCEHNHGGVSHREPARNSGQHGVGTDMQGTNLAGAGIGCKGGNAGQNTGSGGGGGGHDTGFGGNGGSGIVIIRYTL